MTSGYISLTLNVAELKKKTDLQVDIVITENYKAENTHTKESRQCCRFNSIP